MPTPFTWSESEVPTAEQALAWLLVAEPDEQLTVVGNLIHNAELARVCVMSQHDGHITKLRAGVAEALIKVAEVRRLHIANGERKCVAGCGKYPCKTAKAVYQRIELER